MSTQPATSIREDGTPPRRIGRSIWAIVAGFLVVVILSIGTDVVTHRRGIYSPMSNRLFVWATIYRTIYAILGSYVTARVAPNRPMWHAMVGAVIGMILATSGAVSTWNKDLGPHWYPLALIIEGIPCAWIGARIWEQQISR